LAQQTTLIVTAIRVGVRIRDTFSACRTRLEACFHSDQTAILALEQYEADPETWEQPLKKALVSTGAGADEEVVRYAERILEQLRDFPDGGGTYSTTVTGNVGAQNVGEHQTIIINEHGQRFSVPLRGLLERMRGQRKQLDEATKLMQLCQQTCTKLALLRRVRLDPDDVTQWMQLQAQWEPECRQLIDDYTRRSSARLTAPEQRELDLGGTFQALEWLTALRDSAHDLSRLVKSQSRWRQLEHHRETLAALHRMDFNTGQLLKYHAEQVVSAFDSLSDAFEQMTVQLHR
jgi:hypothetical protein